MIANVLSCGLTGIQGQLIMVEVDISGGLPSYDTVGLPDKAVTESRERVRAAIRNSGFSIPPCRKRGKGTICTDCRTKGDADVHIRTPFMLHALRQGKFFFCNIHRQFHFVIPAEIFFF